MDIIEGMADFFTARADSYDEHMLTNVEGCAEGYAEVADLIPDGSRSLLDLGCGTGLELERIFDRFPDMQVTGIDLAPAMLKKLREKYPDRDIKLVAADYFKYDFGEDAFDAAVSVESLHHFTPEKKTELYSRILASLRSGGVYVECDYMVSTQGEQDTLFAEGDRLIAASGMTDGEYIHFDTPCTVENQQKMLLNAGFSCAEHLSRRGSTSVIIARK